MSTNIPSKWAVISVEYGEAQKHLYTPDSQSFEFFATEIEAEKAVDKNLRAGDKMVALLKVDKLFKAKIQTEQIVDQ